MCGTTLDFGRNIADVFEVPVKKVNLFDLGIAHTDYLTELLSGAMTWFL